MNLPRWPKRRAIVIIVAIYSLSYIAARSTHYLIHRRTYETVDERIRYLHSVRSGDFGIPWLAGEHHFHIAAVCEFVFTPARVAEAVAWKVIQPGA